MNEHRWAHQVRYTISKGREKASCVCGWQTPWMDDSRALSSLAKAHTGVKEVTEKGRRSDATAE